MAQFGRMDVVLTIETAVLSAICAIAAIGAGCYGGAQLILGEAPWAFWGVPVAVVLAGFVYGAAFIGQGLGAEDMYELRSVVDRIADGCPAATSLR